MVEQKPGRKALKTKKLIKNALAELLQNKNLKDITVQEVAQKADISRTTFYNYYYDVYDIYEQLEKEVLAELGILTLNFHDNPSKDYGDEFFNYITQNPEVFKMIFSPYNTGELRYKITAMIEGVFRLIQTEKNEVEITDKELDYFSAFWSSGCIAVIQKWVQMDFSPSKDYIIRTLTDFEKQMEIFIVSQLGLR
ncbi:TetR/AcrR family transcriptional regulator [Ruminococcus sp.]|uniref:TetR/AcrR family transcriptional regulator n=1 Tax=Ruminococcus sp. TaxID=41978 RepID=UPI002E77D5D1|nr:TetR/AcrR family transcriptional regulator [Ruminococcus sp.]MEE1261392.1 TetR/AcrR family transcriptional regulator [Ruminococcus sp.]